MRPELSTRDLEFLRESNAIEDIENIDYADPASAKAGCGHVGAFLEMRAAAAQRRSIALDDICRWQRWITEEQARFGHAIPTRGIGVLRGDDAPFNVRVGTHFPPDYPQVAGLMRKWIDDLHARLALPEAAIGALVFTIDTVGEFFQRFEAIHPFVDGNGENRPVGRKLHELVARTDAHRFPRKRASAVLRRSSQQAGDEALHRRKATRGKPLAIHR